MERMRGALGSAGAHVVETAPRLLALLSQLDEEVTNVTARWSAQRATSPEVRTIAFQLYADLTNIVRVSGQTGDELRSRKRPKVASTLALRGLSEVAAQLTSRSHQLDARLQACMQMAGTSSAERGAGADHDVPPIAQLGWLKRHRLERRILELLGELTEGTQAILMALGTPTEADLFHVVGALRQMEGLASWLDGRVLRLARSYASNTSSVRCDQ
jgi:hypothetical protein